MISKSLIFLSLMLAALLLACSGGNSKSRINNFQSHSSEIRQGKLSKAPVFNYQIDTPICNDNGCTGKYAGVEFVNEEHQFKLGLTGTDIAHNYSNLMCKYVGKKLKQLYREGKYSKVDFRNIKMTTKGMDDGDDYVEYSLSIPFKRVENASRAMTGFDHSGGWGHPPEIEKRKYQLLHTKRRIVKNQRLYVSALKSTPEGLQEYWIQWKHADY
jgi:hypothetical protein